MIYNYSKNKIYSGRTNLIKTLKKIKQSGIKKSSSRKKFSKTITQTIKKSAKYRKGLMIGCHASISPSVLDGIKYNESIDGNAVQIFLGSNRSASMKTKTKLTPIEIETIAKYIRQHKIFLIIHSIYLLNFCTALPTSGRVKYMHDNLQYDLHYGALLGAKCVVLHLGFRKDLPPQIAINNLIANLNKILEDKPVGIKLSLETSAGQGSQVGYTLEELQIIWNKIKHHGSKNVGICIDTAHIFVSGYDISTPTGIRVYLEKFDKLIGISYITNFHINDSRYPGGSKRDEHRGIGSGLIYNTPHGKRALKYIKAFCIKHKIPMILETHSAGSATSEGSHAGQHGYEWEIELIRKL